MVLAMENNSMQKSLSFTTEVKKQNRQKIYNYLYHAKGATRMMIVNKLGISLKTVINNLDDLCKEGLVESAGFQNNTGGRKAQLYKISPDAYYSIGIDITPHHINAILIDLNGAPVHVFRIHEPFTRTDSYYKKIGNVVENLCSNDFISEEKILGVGISLPGLVDKNGQNTYYCKVLDIENVNISEFTRYIPFNSMLCHDVDMAAYAELHNNPTMADFFYLLLSETIGGAIFINAQLYSGLHNRSAEIGHLKLAKHGRRCYCGNYGCMDPYCSEKYLTELTNGDLPKFMSMLKDNNSEAKDKWEKYTDNLAIAIHDIHMLFDSNLIIGGHIGEYLTPLMLVDIQKKVQQLDPFKGIPTYIKLCSYKREAAATGAALIFVREFLNQV